MFMGSGWGLLRGLMFRGFGDVRVGANHTRTSHLSQVFVHEHCVHVAVGWQVWRGLRGGAGPQSAGLHTACWSTTHRHV